jgi:hypothetical protein
VDVADNGPLDRGVGVEVEVEGLDSWSNDGPALGPGTFGDDD